MFAQTEKVFRGNIGDDDDDDEHELIEANKTNDQDGLEVRLYEEIWHVSTCI